MRLAERGVAGRDAGAFLVDAQMRPRVHVVRDVVREDAMKPGDTEHDHVIEALASDRADEGSTLGASCRPGRGEPSVPRNPTEQRRQQVVIRERRILFGVEHSPVEHHFSRRSPH